MTTEIVQTVYSAADKAECFRRYTQERTTNKEIADAVKVKESTLKFWIKEGGWRAEKKKIQDEMIKNSTSLFMEHIGKERIRTARDHNEVARMIQDAIKAKFAKREDGSVPFYNERQLATLAKALKDSSDVSARASGLSDKAPEFMGGQGVIQPIVMVGMQPIPVKESTQKESKIIDVTPDVTVLPKKKADPF